MLPLDATRKGTRQLKRERESQKVGHPAANRETARM
jgi:hypothetical protein